ncbi:uncharacterized protein LOC134301163 isoform X2 [Trichomycterus rosablanca]|uniref:uncharacterized protein LOC134301163 isoform X2 n=1 Tax=Trichomycterus rosablanca TaxID=2290929 RepID=UPI002F355748
MNSLQTRGACWSFLKEDEACVMEAAVRTAVMSIMKVFSELNDKRCEFYQLKLAESERQNAALQFQLNEARQELHSSRQTVSNIPNDPISSEATFTFSFSPDFSCSHVAGGQREEAARSSESVCEGIAVGPELKEEPLYESTLCVKTEVVDENCTVHCDPPPTEHVDHIHLHTVDIQRREALNSFSQALQQDSTLSTTEKRRLSTNERVKQYREKIRADPEKYLAWKEKDRLRKKSIQDLSEPMKKLRRKAWREAARRHRARKQTQTALTDQHIVHIPHSQLASTLFTPATGCTF